MVLSSRYPRIQFVDLLISSTSLSTKILSISQVLQIQQTLAKVKILIPLVSTNQTLFVLTPKVITLHALLQKPPVLIP